MKKIILFLTVTMGLFLDQTKAQVTVNNTNTVQFYVQNVLLGGGVTVSNITYNGVPAGIVDAKVGQFTDPTSSVGLANGMILATGDAIIAQGPNSSGGAGNSAGIGTSGQDPDLSAITTNPLNDQCIVEFDFVPLGDTLTFNYVFASEEYNEYVCSDYNDVFGFFLTGNNPLGGTYNAYNLARVPTPGVPGSFTNTPVAINTITPGVAGSNGDAANCSAIDPSWTAYSIYHVTNSSNNYQYDGRTVSLPVFALVNCGETYHIKMAIADVQDGAFDSGVFLEAGSFASNGSLDATTAVVPNDIMLCSQPYEITVNAGPTPPPISFWDFGDGIGTSNLANTTYTYADTGTYTVTYIASDPSACVESDTAYFTVTIRENVPLDAQINIPPYDPCSPGGLTIDFEFTGAGADSIHWNMGNGTTFIDSTSFQYTYTVGGSYVLTFQAWDFDCGGYSQIIDTVHFNPNYTQVNATPPGNQSFCSQPYLVNFDAGATPPPNNFWDFGDGVGTSTLANTSYTYADTGIYNVMYVAIDSSTCNIADTAYFTVELIKPEELNAQFVIPPYDPCSPSGLTVQLDFTGTGADSIYWNMGDGTSFINDTSVTYTYNTPGTFFLEFIAFDFDCNVSDTIRDTIFYNPNFTQVNATPPGNQSFCSQPYLVNFDAGATPPPNNFWDFGDGVGSSILPNPQYTYGDTGTYTVMYVAIDSSTCNIADTAYFTVELIKPEELDAQFVIPPYDPCQPTLTVQFDFTGTGADSIYWNMGDGTSFINNISVNYTYNTPGVYPVEFIAFDFDCNVSDTIRDTIYFNPTTTTVTAVVPPNITICGSPLTVNFNSGSPAPPQNFWDFGDGNTSTAIDPAHNYATTGTYTVMFVAIDSSTCNIADSATFSVSLAQAPDLNVNIAYTPPVPCEATNYKVELSAIGSGADSIYWNMGDGTTYIDSTFIAYEYASAGTYNIAVSLFNFFCNRIVTENLVAEFYEPKETKGIVPNVFTPNGDNWNDKLVFVGVDNTQDFSIKIFDRWGRKKFESTDATDHWDGENASEGTYFYELKYTDVCSNIEKLVTGTVTLLRGPKKQ
ncbi:MAG: choice-of-anchor L domain-containing protein [Flavobacteriales bacterium]|nr:choice-of-anchor L domain-containing protein [Flavobacteriales bacterium]